jgi:hypothetical protein
VVERFSFAAPRTRELAALLGKLGIDGRKVLVLTAAHNANVYLSGRNLPNVEVMRYADASAYDILWSDAVVIEEGALTGVIPEITDEPDSTKTPKAAKAASAAKASKAAKSAKRGTAKSAKAAKAAARKPAKKPALKTSAKAPAKKSVPRKKKGDA